MSTRANSTEIYKTPSAKQEGKILQIRNLKTYFFTQAGIVKAVDGVDLELEGRKTLGIVGESGCGKSTLGFSILGLIPPQGRIVEGDIIFAGENITRKSNAELRRLRGRRISAIFQDPSSSLNPVMKIGDHLVELFLTHWKLDKDSAKIEAVKLLEDFGIQARRFSDYPHQFSGGMKQRIVIALALALKPELVIADEPTTALDVIVQANILKLLKNFKKKYNLSLVLISHDLSVVAELADKIAVMYAGKVVEYSDVITLYENPLHPYTQGLLSSIPKIHVSEKYPETIHGSPPDLLNLPSGCRFHPRCPYAREECKIREPQPVELDEGRRRVWCLRYEDQRK